MKRCIIMILLAVAALAVAEEPAKPEKKEEPIPTIDLDTIATGKLKAGLELGYPFSGLTAGYRFSEKMEGNVIVGSVLDFDRLALGINVMFTLAQLKSGDYLFPLSAAPVIYGEFTSESAVYYGGALVRIEHTLESPVNLYLQTGCIVAFDADDPGFFWPIGLGIRYVF